jgi:hypothetical protein
LADVERTQLRGEFQYKLNDIWTLRNRLEWTGYEKEQSEHSQGWLLYQDVFWRSAHLGLQANIRIAYFDTQGYNARLYAYESDVLYASSFPIDKETIGSGLDALEGNKRSDVKFQIRWQW